MIHGVLAVDVGEARILEESTDDVRESLEAVEFSGDDCCEVVTSLDGYSSHLMQPGLDVPRPGGKLAQSSSRAAPRNSASERTILRFNGVTWSITRMAVRIPVRAKPPVMPPLCIAEWPSICARDLITASNP